MLELGITRKQNGADLTRSPLQVRGLRDEPLVEITTNRDHALRRLAAAVLDCGQSFREQVI
jgi:hypothetical protein